MERGAVVAEASRAAMIGLAWAQAQASGSVWPKAALAFHAFVDVLRRCLSVARRQGRIHRALVVQVLKLLGQL